AKWINWIRLLLEVAGPTHWGELRNDLRHLIRALRVREVTDRPSLGQLMLDGSVNALRDLFGRPRPNLPPAGTIRLRYSVAEGEDPIGLQPGPLQKWFRRFARVLGGAARKVYTNDRTPLLDKLPGASRLLVRQVNMLDLLAAVCLGEAAGFTALWLTGWDRLRDLMRWRRLGRPPPPPYPRYALAARRATDLTPVVAAAAPNWEARLGQLSYQTVKASHIHVLWPKALQTKNAVINEGLWHVCPAHVYEARVNPQGQLQVVVN